MKKIWKILMLAMLALLMSACLALFAGASENAGVLTVAYPDGTTQTFAEGEAVTKPAVPSDFPLIVDGKAYKYTVTGADWEYSSPLPAVVSAADLGKTVTASVAGTRGTEQVYYTSEEKTGAGTVLVYHLKNNLNTFLSTSNTGDRGDGTNTGASSYAELRKKTSETRIKLYADHTCSSFTISWFVSSDRYLGGPVYLDLNGHTVTNTQTSWISANGMTLYLYSSRPDGHWYQTKSSSILRVNDDIKFFIGDDGSGRYIDNLSVHAKALFHDVYGQGANVIGGRYYQTGVSSYGGMIDIKRRMYTFENAKIFALEGQTPLTDATADDNNASPIGKGTKAIKNCTFYAPCESSILTSTRSATLCFEGCNFINVRMDTAVGSATLSYAADNYTNLPQRKNLGKSGTSIYPVKLSEPRTLSLYDVDGAPITAVLDYKTAAVAGGLTVSYGEESMLRLIGEDAAWKFAPDVYVENGVPYKKTAETHTVVIDGTPITNAVVTEEMAGKSATGEFSATYAPALFTVAVGEKVSYYVNEQTYAQDLAACLGALESGARVTLYKDVTLAPLTVAGKRIADGAAARGASATLDLNGHTVSFSGSGVALSVKMPGFSIVSSAPSAAVIAESHALFATAADDYKWIGGAAYAPSDAEYAQNTAVASIAPQGFLSICPEGEQISFKVARVNADLHGGGAEILGGAFLQSTVSASPYFLLLSRTEGAVRGLARVENATFVLTGAQTAPLLYNAAGAVTFKGCRFLSASGAPTSLFAAENPLLPSAPCFEDCDFFDILPVRYYGERSVTYTGCAFGFSADAPAGDLDPSTGGAFLVDGTVKTTSVFGFSFTLDRALSVTEYDYVDILYPDGHRATVSVGDVIGDYAMADTKTEERRLYKLVGEGWTYSLLGTPIAGSTVPPEAAGECLVASGYEYRKVYYTTLEQTSSSSVLVYHLKNDLAYYYLSKNNQGDRGDGTNTGAQSYEILRQKTTVKVQITLYEDVVCDEFITDWHDAENVIDGRPVYLNLNGFSVINGSRSFLDILGMYLYIYSTESGACWRQEDSSTLFRPNDRGALVLGDIKADGTNADNITFYGKALCSPVYGGGIYIRGGHYRQTAPTSVFVELGRRIKEMSHASFYVVDGTTAVLGYTVAKDGSSVLTGSSTITSCYFYAPVFAHLFYETQEGANLVFSGSTLEGVSEKYEDRYAVLVYPDGREQQLLLGDAITLDAPSTVHTDAMGKLLYLLEANWRILDENGTDVTDSFTRVIPSMTDKRYTAVAAHEYARVFYTVRVGDDITYNINAEDYGLDLQRYLSAMDAGAVITLYSDVVLSPVRVTSRMGAGRMQTIGGRYSLDLNGYTVSFAENQGVCFDVRVSDFYIYSSVPGGRILAEGLSLVRTSAKEYVLDNGTKHTVYGCVTLGSSIRTASAAGRNLTVICRALNAASENGEIYLRGGSYVQSERGAREVFVILDGASLYDMLDASLLVCSESAIGCVDVTLATFKECRIISLSGSVTRLLSAPVGATVRRITTEDCGFYNILPEITLCGSAVTYTGARFGFPSVSPSDDLDSGIGETYFVGAGETTTISALGRIYVLRYMLEQRIAEGCTVVYPDGSTQIFPVGSQITPITGAESFSGLDGLLYKRSSSGWCFLLNGTALTDTYVTEAMRGQTVTATGYDRVYYTVETSEGILYHTNASTAASSLCSYLTAMDPGACVVLWSDLTVSKVTVRGKRFEDGSIGKDARYYFDLNGFKLSFSATSGVAMHFQTANLYLYSSRPGAEILAEKLIFFYTDNDDYKWVNGAAYAKGTNTYSNATAAKAIQIYASLYIGERVSGVKEYGDNLTIRCAAINQDMYGTAAYFCGGTFVQSSSSMAEYFILLSRRAKGNSQVKSFANTTFVITNASTAVMFYNSGLNLPFTDCRFVSTAGPATLCYGQSYFKNRPTFTNCSFYDVNPTVDIEGVTVTYADCVFGFSGTAPEGDLDSTALFAAYSPVAAEEISVLGVTYSLTHVMLQASEGFVTVVYPHGYSEVVALGGVISPFTSEEAFLSNGILYADMGEGWIFSVDGTALTDLTVTEAIAGKTVTASGYGRVYFSVRVGNDTVYYTDASTFAKDLKAYLGAMTPGAYITLYADVSLSSSVTVAGARCENATLLRNAEYRFDLNGHTLTFTGTSSLAFDVKAAGFHIYSSVPGAYILAERQSLFRSNDDDYKWINGRAYSKGTTEYTNSSLTNKQINGCVIFGEDALDVVRYGENLTAVCAAINSDMYGDGAYLVGGTFVQSEASTAEYFFCLSRKSSRQPHIKAVANVTLVLRNKNTAMMHYNASVAVAFTGCRFLCIAGGEAALFSSSVSAFKTSPAFDSCLFYDVIPEKERTVAVCYTDCTFGFSGPAPIVDGLYLAHSAAVMLCTYGGREYMMDCVLATDLSEVCTVLWGDSFKEYWMLGTVPQSDPFYMDALVYGSNGSAVFKSGAIMNAADLPIITASMLGTERRIEVSYASVTPVAFTYTDVYGTVFYQLMQPGTSDEQVGDLFYAMFNECDGAYVIRMHADMLLTKGVGFGPLVSVDTTKEHNSLANGSVTLDLNGFKITVPSGCVGINGSNSNNSSNYPKVAWGVFTFETVTQNTFTLTSSRAGARIENLSTCSLIVIGEQSTAKVVIEGENIEIDSLGTIAFSYEVANSTATLTVRGGSYYYKGGAAPFICVGTASVSDARIYMTGAPISAFGAHYYNRSLTFTVKNTQVYSKNQTSLFAFYSSAQKKMTATTGYTRTLALEDCVFIGVTLTSPDTGLTSVTHDGTAVQSTETLLSLYGTQPANTTLANLERTVDGVTYRLYAYLTAERIGVVDWGFGLPTEYWRIGETATRKQATVFSKFGYVFLPTEVNGAAVVGNARLAAMRPGMLQMSLTLQGQIGVNIYLSEELGATAITVAGITYDLSRVGMLDGYYHFVAPVASNMANQGVDVVIHAYGYDHPLQISIEKYAAAILAADAYASAHDLTYAMVAHIEAQTGVSFASCPVPDGYFERVAEPFASQNAGKTLLKGITFRLEGTIALAVLGMEGTTVNLVLSDGRSERVVIENGSAVFDGIYINEFYGDMKIHATKNGVKETYVYNLLNYLYYQTDPVLIEKVSSLYNYTYFAHLYVDAVSGIIEDRNGDHICDICHKSETPHTDVNADGICDLCDAALKWSEGLVFERNVDTTSVTVRCGYTLVGVGECTDTALVIPDTYLGYPVTAIGENALKGTSVTSVTLPRSILRIQENAFEGCTALTSIVIGGGITDIKDNAFAGCTALSAVYFRGRTSMWRSVWIGDGNDALSSATVYCFSEIRPEADGYYWYEGENGIEIHHADFDRDHFCDDCGVRLTEHADPSRDHNCDRCGETISGCADGDGDHLCDVCLRTVSTCADNNQNHLCDVCGISLSEHLNADGDHFCDYCGERVTACFDYGNDHICDLCGERESECSDADDHLCDVCGSVLSLCADENCDHFCDICITRLSSCTDSQNDHICDVCGIAVSAHADADGDRVCDICGGTMDDCVDEDGDHICDDCGAICSTCLDADANHLCDICGERLPCLDLNGDHVCEVCGERANECADEDKNHFCDLCGERLSSCADLDCDHLCDICGAALTVHKDLDGDHLCDICAQKAFACEDLDLDHICDKCGSTVSYCRDGGAALCVYCGRLLASEGLRYRENKDGTYTVIGLGDCTDAYIYIPKYYNGKEVTAVGGAAFAAKRGIIGVSIPDSVQRIGIAAFAACLDLSEVRIGRGVQSIGAWAFALCDRLVSAELLGGASIGTGAFYACTSLKTLSLGSTRVISLGAFYDCVNLELLSLPESLERVGVFAFAGCDRLESLYLPERAIGFGYGAFASCDALAKVHFAGSVDTLGAAQIADKNTSLILAVRYFFAEAAPTEGQGRFWYYTEGGEVALITLCPAHTDENRNRTCDLCGEKVACEHALDAEGYCLWCSYYICTVHDDYEADGFCDLCGVGLGCEAHTDVDVDHICDDCSSYFACSAHVDDDGDGSCDCCRGVLRVTTFPWESKNITVELSSHSNDGAFIARVQSFMAGELVLASALTEREILLRNEEAIAATGVTPSYRYLSDHYEDYGWSARFERIMVQQAAGIYADVYCDFAYDMIAASLAGAFANLKTAESENYFDFAASRKYGDSVGDSSGYMYAYMQSLAFDEDRMYLLASDYFIDAVRAFYCMPANAAMLNALSENDVLGLGRANTLSDLTDAVSSGAWTYDLVMRYSAALADSDRLGLVLGTDENSAAGLLYTSAVNVFAQSGTQGALKENDAFYFFARALERLSKADGVGTVSDWREAKHIFTSGGALFGGVTLLGALENSAYGEMGGVLILPVPVHTAGVAYETRIHDYGRIGAISAKSKSFDACSAFLNYQSTHSQSVLASYFANDLRAPLEGTDAALGAANAEMLALMRASVGSASVQMRDISIAMICSGRSSVSADGEASFTALRWQSILAAERYDSTYIRSYYRMLSEKKAHLLSLIYKNGATSLPR